MHYIRIEVRKDSTVIENIIEPQVKYSVKMFDYWIWNSKNNGNYVLQLRYLDDFERISNLLNGLRNIEQAKEISYEDYKHTVWR